MKEKDITECGRCNLTAGIINKHQNIQSLAKIEVQHRCKLISGGGQG